MSSAAEKLKALDVLPKPYQGRRYSVLCARCGGSGEVGPENHDDPKAFPCGECKSSGLREPYRSYVRALPQIVAVVEALETATDWYDRAAHSRPRPDWIESGGVALAALDEALGLGSPPGSETLTAPWPGYEC